MIGDPFSKHLKQMVYCLKSMLLFREWSVELGYFRKMFCCSASTDVRFATLMKCVPYSHPLAPGSVPSIEFAYRAKVSFLVSPACFFNIALGKSLLTPPVETSRSFQKRAITMQKIFENKCHLRVYN